MKQFIAYHWDNLPVVQDETCSKHLENAIEDWYEDDEATPVDNVLDTLAEAMVDDLEVYVPLIVRTDSPDQESLLGKTITNDPQGVLNILFLEDKSGQLWLPAYTNAEKLEKSDGTWVMLEYFRSVLKNMMREPDIDGVIINPWGQNLKLSKDLCAALYDYTRSKTTDEILLDTGADAYQNGDYETAMMYYKQSAKLGNVTALSNLGYCYYYGRDISVNKEKAKKYWEKAAMLGDIAALYKLGDMYRNGDLKQDLDYSHALYKRAFNMSLKTDDIYVYPDAYLRMLKYYPEEACTNFQSIEDIARGCVSSLEARIADGDHYSKKVLEEAKAILAELTQK